MKPSRLLVLALAAVGLAGLVAVGCGDSDESTAAAAITKAQFIKQGDAICKRVDVIQEADFRDYSKSKPTFGASKKGQEELIEKVGLPPVRKAIRELSELGSPEGSEKQGEAIISHMEAALATAENDPLSIQTAPNATPFAPVNEEAKKYGFKFCSEIL